MSLPTELAELLKARRQQSAWSGDEHLIFCREDGRPLDPDRLRREVLYPALEKAGIERQPRETGFHALRHAAGSILYEMTRDLEMVKRFLRHSRIGTTSDIYLHPAPVVAAEATEAMASVFLGVSEVEGVQ